VPGPGRLFVSASLEISPACGAGNIARVGLFVGDTGIPGSGREIPSGTMTRVDIAGVTPAALPAGNHAVSMRFQCLTGSYSGWSLDEGQATVVLLGG
jgi:hypothetical protein